MDENLFLFFRNHNIWYKKARYWKCFKSVRKIA